MADLPTGTVSFLLSDIVGSTSLWERHPEMMADAVARHGVVIDDAVRACGGTVLKARGEGDSTFSVFPRASDAVAAALSAQRALLDEPWPELTPISVRMAVHTGEVFERDGDYYGPTVNRAARIRSLAVGGQVLVSHSAAELVRDALPDQAVLVDLGSHALSDLRRGEALSALAAPGLPEVAARVATSVQPNAEALEMPLPPRLQRVGRGLVGRLRELEFLGDALKQVGSGPGVRAVLVSGESGIGKTALVSRLARDAHDQGVVVLYGRCDEDLGVPYQPWVEALSPFVEHGPEALLQAHVEARGGDLLALVPDLAARLHKTPAARSADRDVERHLLYAAVVDLLSRAAAQAPVLLILDDLQWADRPSLLLLRHLMASFTRQPFVVLAAFRTAEVSAEEPLGELLAALHREPGVERMNLGGLDDLELLDLMQAAVGQALGGETVGLRDALAAETDGNPFFVLEVLRHLAETGAIGSSHGGGRATTLDLSARGLPVSVREVIGRRVHRLGGGAIRILAAAAVIGVDFNSQLLGPVAEMPEDEVLNALDAATGAELIMETSGAPGRFSFVHALIQRSVHDQLSAPRRQRLHRRIAEALEALPGPSGRLAELAHHWAAAGNAAPTDKVLDAAVAAGDDARARLAPDEAVRWYSHALEVIANRLDPASRDVERCDVLLRVGTAQRLAGRPEFGQTLLEAAQLAQRRGDTDRLVEAALKNTRGMTAHFGRLDVERITVLRAALDAVGTSSPGLRARLLAQWASETTLSPGYDNQALIAEALELTEASDDPEARLGALGALTARAIPHNLQQRRACQAELLELVSQLDPAQQCLPFSTCCVTAVQSGKPVEAQRFLDEMARTAEAAGDPAGRWMAKTFAAALSALHGDHVAAEEQANAALHLGLETAQPDAYQVHATLIGAVRKVQGREAELYDGFVRLAAEYPGMRTLRGALAWLLAANDRVDEARTVLDEVVVEIPGLWVDRVWASMLANCVEAAALIGHTATPQMVVPMLEPFADQWIFNGGNTDGPIALVLGVARTTLKDYERANEHFEHALAMARHMESCYWIARTQLERATMIARRSNADGRRHATKLAREAARTASRCGYEGIERRAQALIANP